MLKEGGMSMSKTSQNLFIYWLSVFSRSRLQLQTMNISWRGGGLGPDQTPPTTTASKSLIVIQCYYYMYDGRRSKVLVFVFPSNQTDLSLPCIHLYVLCIPWRWRKRVETFLFSPPLSESRELFSPPPSLQKINNKILVQRALGFSTPSILHASIMSSRDYRLSLGPLPA